MTYPNHQRVRHSEPQAFRAGAFARLLGLAPQTEFDAALAIESADGLFEIKCVDVSADLATDGATTALALALPAGVQVLAHQANIETAIADIDGTTFTLALTGGATDTLGTFAAATKNAKSNGLHISDDVVTTDVTNASFVISGGSDQTPSAGRVRLVVWYAQLSDLADAA